MASIAFRQWLYSPRAAIATGFVYGFWLTAGPDGKALVQAPISTLIVGSAIGTLTSMITEFTYGIMPHRATPLIPLVLSAAMIYETHRYVTTGKKGFQIKVEL